MKLRKAQKDEKIAKFEEMCENWKGNRFSEFAARFARDKRFLAFDKMKERETLFFSYKKKLKDKSLNDSKKKKEDIKLDFMDILDKKKCQTLKNWEEVEEKLKDTSEFKAAPEEERLKIFSLNKSGNFSGVPGMWASSKHWLLSRMKTRK